MEDTISISKFRKNVAHYNTETILQMCSHISTGLEKKGKTIETGIVRETFRNFTFRKQVTIAHHAIAIVAMTALRQYRWSNGKELNEWNMIRLINNVAHIDDPLVEHETNPLTLVIRLCHQQWPFQEGVYYFIPRHLLLYTFVNISSSTIDPKTIFVNKTGLTIEEFMILGTLMWAAASQHHTFDRKFLEDTPEKKLQPYVSSDKLTAFLSIAGADFETFRQLCLAEEHECPGAGSYQFNPLFDRPAIIRKDSLLCLPVPRLVIHRVTKGLYYDLLEEFAGMEGNAFAEWFGHAFEYYGGLLLRDTFGEENVYPEPRYGRSEVRGPDWTVIKDDTALVLEFRSGRFHKKAKTYADFEEIILLLQRNIIHTLRNLPRKIEALKSGVTNIPTTCSMQYYPIIVTCDPLYPHEQMFQLIKRELNAGNMPDFHFELMSIEDLEWFLAWSTQGDPIELLRKKWSSESTKDMNIRSFIATEAQENIKNLRNPLLERTWSQYLGKLGIQL